MKTELETIIVEQDGRTVTITLNRPDKLNAINDTMLKELKETFERLTGDPDIRVVVIKGAGKAFSAGQDLSGVDTQLVMPPDPLTKPYLSELHVQALRSYQIWRSFFDFPRFTIAQVHGHCLGAGCDLAMTCRAVFAAEDAIFGDPSVRMGLAPANPLWVWRVGVKKAKELLLASEYVSGKEAERIGLATKAVPADRLEDEVKAAAALMAGFGTMGGYDEEVGFEMFSRAALDAAGFSAAWRYTSHLWALSAAQRPGRSITGRGEFNFYDARARHGLKAAIRKRDAPYRAPYRAYES
ncbi:MAG: enoyl-CoA hydratase/isomerase family protein [Chloroflexota bacterium]